MTEFYKNKKYIIKDKLLKNLRDIYESESFKDEEIIKQFNIFMKSITIFLILILLQA